MENKNIINNNILPEGTQVRVLKTEMRRLLVIESLGTKSLKARVKSTLPFLDNGKRGIRFLLRLFYLKNF